MINKKGQNYCCENCNFYTDNKTKYNRHLKTKKHLLKVDKKQNICICGKSYVTYSGLFRHKKKCQVIKDLKLEEDMTKDEIIKMQEKEIEMKDKKYNKLQDSYINTLEKHKDTLEKQQGKLLEIANKPNIINNQMTINVYLNEKCKGAMNLTDFVDQIKVSLQDLSFTNKNGLIEGVSNIFVKELEDMKPTERPIHCSNKKDMQVYIKDSDEWTNDKQHFKLDKSIENVMNKQLKQIKIWEKEHPDFMKDEKLVLEWNNMIKNTIIDKEKDIAAIKKKILPNVELEELD
jgi:hypothetical protein